MARIGRGRPASAYLIYTRKLQILLANVAAADTATGLDGAAVAANIADDDTGSSLDAATVLVVATGAGGDAGSGSDTGIVSMQVVPAADASGTTLESATVLVVATTDPAGGTDNVLNRTVTDADAATGADLSTVRVIAATDSGAGVDDAPTRTVKPDTDSGSGTDTATVGVVPATDSGSGLDNAAAFNTAIVGDSGTALDVATVRVFDGDTGTGVDAVNVRTIPATGDTGAGTDAATAVRLPVADTGTGLDGATVLVLATGDTVTAFDNSPQPIANNFGVDAGALVDVATILVADNDTGAGADNARAGVVGVLDATLRTYLVDPDPETSLPGDVGNRTATADGDPVLHLGDGVVGAGSNRTVLCEVEQFVNV